MAGLMSDSDFCRLQGQYKMATNAVLKWLRGLTKESESTTSVSYYKTLAANALARGIEVPPKIQHDLETAIRLRTDAQIHHTLRGDNDENHDFMLSVLQDVRSKLAPQMTIRRNSGPPSPSRAPVPPPAIPAPVPHYPPVTASMEYDQLYLQQYYAQYWQQLYQQSWMGASWPASSQDNSGFAYAHSHPRLQYGNIWGTNNASEALVPNLQ
ncbi:uncharacterized protein HMPREF1541_07247 [Cyphellophora europaea CBS 101466]|uniref:DUF6604 domain-containing protein n=1 Tax=Cyphellophora europaea (strain CBS 101466) TaxID=1220924 RepID=W2RMR9_CYPE1|nr:uncharacterized protein HMPREF1541_07247 [Cyphellophora europaea CBS 101466]ETN37625.1 hypothetical protein HMPREF1541_07247 [Cyphellophora europaea CBS 101466]